MIKNYPLKRFHIFVFYKPNCDLSEKKIKQQETRNNIRPCAEGKIIATQRVPGDIVNRE